MNYLGHSLLSFQDKEILFGNMIGDYVKGLKRLEEYTENIQKGILLHRKIDEFTDKHIAAVMAKNLFRPEYKLYAGAFVDVTFDYFLANDPRFFASEQDLEDYCTKTYENIEVYKAQFPEGFAKMFPYMQSQNWLYNYRTVKGIEKAFQGLVRRAQYLEDSNAAYQIFITHFYELNQRYYEFIDDVVLFVKNELN